MTEAATDKAHKATSADRRIEHWSDLSSLVDVRNKVERSVAWIYRGVPDARYLLQPAIGRPGTRKDIDSGADIALRPRLEWEVLTRFQREVRPHFQRSAREDVVHDWDLQAIAQHHGLKTRLLDWSESPLIAAFFAVESEGIVDQKPTDAALYATPCPLALETTNADWPPEAEVLAFYPPHLTPRITVQRGLFTIHREPERPWQPQLLRKWIIPSESCLSLKVALNRAGVNRASLFPDPDGIAAHINWMHKYGLK